MAPKRSPADWWFAVTRYAFRPAIRYLHRALPFFISFSPAFSTAPMSLRSMRRGLFVVRVESEQESAFDRPLPRLVINFFTVAGERWLQERMCP